MTQLLHFDRVLQIVFVVLAGHYGLSYRRLVEAVMDADPARFPVSGGLCRRFRARGAAIQTGAPEYIPSRKYLNIWWPIHQYGLVELVVEDRLDRFYDEVEILLAEMSTARGIDLEPDVVRDAIALNRAMMCTPGRLTDLEVTTSYNVLEFYEAVVAGLPAVIEPRRSTYHVDRTSTVWLSWEAWCWDVVMQLYRRDGLLYPARAIGSGAATAEAALPHARR
jgi:hypothetical protein